MLGTTTAPAMLSAATAPTTSQARAPAPSHARLTGWTGPLVIMSHPLLPSVGGAGEGVPPTLGGTGGNRGRTRIALGRRGHHRPWWIRSIAVSIENRQHIPEGFRRCPATSKGS